MPSLGLGSTLGVDDGASGYDTIAGVDNLNIDFGQGDDVDVTDWDSPNGYEEIIQGIKRGGNATFSVNSDPETGTPASNYDRLIELHASGDVKEWQLVLKDADGVTTATITVDAIVKGFTIAIPTGDKKLSSITLRLTGAPTWA